MLDEGASSRGVSGEGLTMLRKIRENSFWLVPYMVAAMTSCGSPPISRSGGIDTDGRSADAREGMLGQAPYSDLVERLGEAQADLEGPVKSDSGARSRSVIGVIGMIVRRIQRSSETVAFGLPASDWPAYGLLGGIIIVGFFLEGMRMAMTGSPGGAPYAFVGDAVSRMLTGLELTGVYGYIWYLHAILTGAFVVYLPFSRMFHMIMAPVVMAMNAASDHSRG